MYLLVCFIVHPHNWQATRSAITGFTGAGNLLHSINLPPAIQHPIAHAQRHCVCLCHRQPHRALSLSPHHGSLWLAGHLLHLWGHRLPAACSLDGPRPLQHSLSSHPVHLCSSTRCTAHVTGGQVTGCQAAHQHAGPHVQARHLGTHHRQHCEPLGVGPALPMMLLHRLGMHPLQGGQKMYGWHLHDADGLTTTLQLWRQRCIPS